MKCHCIAGEIMVRSDIWGVQTQNGGGLQNAKLNNSGSIIDKDVNANVKPTLHYDISYRAVH